MINSCKKDRNSHTCELQKKDRIIETVAKIQHDYVSDRKKFNLICKKSRKNIEICEAPKPVPTTFVKICHWKLIAIAIKQETICSLVFQSFQFVVYTAMVIPLRSVKNSFVVLCNRILWVALTLFIV